MSLTDECRNYEVRWSPEDGEYVATCPDFPSLSWLAADPADALGGLHDVILKGGRDLA